MVHISIRQWITASTAAAVVAAGMVIPGFTLSGQSVAIAATGDPNGTLNVTVNDSVTGAPVEGAAVTITCDPPLGGATGGATGGDTGGDTSTKTADKSFIATAALGSLNTAEERTDNAGVATFTGIPEGSTCRVTANGECSISSQTVTVNGNESVTLTSTCPPTGSLTITTHTPNSPDGTPGKPVPNVPFDVTCTPVGTDGGSTRIVDPDDPWGDDGDTASVIKDFSFISSRAYDSAGVNQVVTNDQGSEQITSIKPGLDGQRCTVTPRELPQDQFPDCTIEPNSAQEYLITKDNLNAAADFAVACKNPVSFTKVDADDATKKLQGFTFTLTDPAGQTVEATSDAVGTVKFPPVAAGTYTLAETGGPADSAYARSEETRTVAVSAEPNKPVVLDENFVNHLIKGSVTFKKEGERRFPEEGEAKLQPLPGAKFQLNRQTTLADGSEQREPFGQVVTSDSEGLIRFTDIPKGRYCIAEVEAPAGYLQRTNCEPSFDITTQGQNIDLTGSPLTNELKKGVITFKKLQENSTNPDQEIPLPGAVFEFADANGVVRDTKTSDDQGNVTSERLPLGEYTVTEKTPPAGWTWLSDNAKSFTVNLTKVYIFEGEQQADPVFNARIYGSIELVKVDGEDQPLAGAVFVLKKKDGTIVNELTSRVDDNPELAGKVIFQNVEFGEYTVEEKDAPAGYTKDDTVRPVKIETNRQVVDLGKIANTKIVTPEPQPKPEPNKDLEPTPEPQPKPEPTPEPQPKPKPDPKPEPNKDPEPVSDKDPLTNPGSDFVPQSKPKPSPFPWPLPAPDPQPEPAPAPQPEPTPQPAPEKPGVAAATVTVELPRKGLAHTGANGMLAALSAVLMVAGGAVVAVRRRQS